MGEEFWIGIWCGLGFSLLVIVTLSISLGN
jgi:uncharacterized iron-regulated membrane protein